MVWQFLHQLWKHIEPDEAGQGQTEYMLLLSLAVITVLFVLVGLGLAVYYLWGDIVTALPF